MSLNPALNPVEDLSRVHHPADTLLLQPLKSAQDAADLDKPPNVNEVSWMRNSNLFSRKAGSRPKNEFSNIKWVFGNS